MLVRPALALWILGTMVVGIVGFPTSVLSEYKGQRRQLGRLESTPFSFNIDWDKVDKELHSLLNEFKTTKSLTSSSVSPKSTPPSTSSSVSTKPTPPPSTAPSIASTTISRPPVLPVSPNPSSIFSSLSFTFTRSSSSSHSSSPSPSPSLSSFPPHSSPSTDSHTTPPPSSTPPSSSRSTSSPLSPPSSSPSSPSLPASSSSSSPRSSPLSSSPHPSTSSSSLPSPSPRPKPVSTSSSSPLEIKTITTTTTAVKTTTTITTTTSKTTTTTATTKPTTTTISTVPTRTGASSIQPPYFVVYTDESAFGFPTSEQIKGFNIVILSFFLSNSEAADQAAAWAQLPVSKRDSIRADYKANNISLMVSALGSTEAPTTRGIDPVKYAQDVAAWAIQFGLDGVDVDYEDFEAVGAGTALKWLVTFTTTLRSSLLDDMMLSHAPVGPWLGDGEVYSQLEQKVGAAIDFYNVQFYSQGTLYTTCDSLLTTSGGAFPGSSLFEIIAGGIPAKKLVVGKPGVLLDVGISEDLLGIVTVGSDPVVHSSGAQQQSKRGLVKRDSVTNTNGFMKPDLLAMCLVNAVSQGWSTGVMAWEYPDANGSWIQTVRSLAFPLPPN